MPQDNQSSLPPAVGLLTRLPHPKSNFPRPRVPPPNPWGALVGEPSVQRMCWLCGRKRSRPSRSRQSDGEPRRGSGSSFPPSGGRRLSPPPAGRSPAVPQNKQRGRGGRRNPHSCNYRRTFRLSLPPPPGAPFPNGGRARLHSGGRPFLPPLNLRLHKTRPPTAVPASTVQLLVL